MAHWQTVQVSVKDAAVRRGPVNTWAVAVGGRLISGGQGDRRDWVGRAGRAHSRRQAPLPGLCLEGTQSVAWTKTCYQSISSEVRHCPAGGTCARLDGIHRVRRRLCGCLLSGQAPRGPEVPGSVWLVATGTVTSRIRRWPGRRVLEAAACTPGPGGQVPGSWPRPAHSGGGQLVPVTTGGDLMRYRCRRHSTPRLRPAPRARQPRRPGARFQDPPKSCLAMTTRWIWLVPS
jgi:hypothetical protein